MKELSPTETALDRAYHWERSAPDAVYLTQPVGGGQVKDFTWRQAMGEARRMASHLRSRSLPPGSHIALLSKNTAYFIIADLAIMMAGHVSIPLYPTLTPDVLATILEHSDSKLIFVGKLDGWEEMAPGIPGDLERIVMPLAPPAAGLAWNEALAGAEPLAENPRRDRRELATIVYTSGSTGRPKGVMLSFGAMAVAAINFGRIYGQGPQDRMLSYLPLAHVYERWAVETCSLVWGYRVFFAESLDTFLADLKRARPTLFVSVPRLWLKFQLNVLIKLPPRKLALLLRIPVISSLIRKLVLAKLGLDRVRFAGSGSAPIPAELIRWYRDLGLELLEGYGMSENFGYSHLSRPGEARVGYVGHPAPGVEHRIGEEGEIQVKSPCSMMGYYRQPEHSAAAFTDDGFLRTGDCGEIDGQGRLRITGRLKEIFKTSKGKYVAPAPIENLLLAGGDLDQACVTGAGLPQPHAVAVLCEELCAELASGGSRGAVTERLSAHLRSVNAELSRHEQLRFIAVVADRWQIENGFLTPTLKLKRATVEDAYGDLAEVWHAAQTPVVWHQQPAARSGRRPGPSPAGPPAPSPA